MLTDKNFKGPSPSTEKTSTQTTHRKETQHPDELQSTTISPLHSLTCHLLRFSEKYRPLRSTLWNPLVKGPCRRYLPSHGEVPPSYVSLPTKFVSETISEGVVELDTIPWHTPTLCLGRSEFRSVLLRFSFVSDKRQRNISKRNNFRLVRLLGQS